MVAGPPAGPGRSGVWAAGVKPLRVRTGEQEGPTHIANVSTSNQAHWHLARWQAPYQPALFWERLSSGTPLLGPDPGHRRTNPLYVASSHSCPAGRGAAPHTTRSPLRYRSTDSPSLTCNAPWPYRAGGWGLCLTEQPGHPLPPYSTCHS